MKAIGRQSYLAKIATHLGKDTIIIIVGQRRVGKSYSLRLFRDKVAEDIHANGIRRASGFASSSFQTECAMVRIQPSFSGHLKKRVYSLLQ